jgi:catechol 2,3-dioxygenase-like lactoylglutathione lyase family enzyme
MDMKITRVSAQVRNTSAAAEFFENVLGLGVERAPGAVVVRIGTTLLELVENPEADGDHHFAVTIPSNKFAEAKQWLQQRTMLLGTVEIDEFECSSAWNSRSLYFAGPDRSVLELIIRRDLHNTTPGPFSSDDLLCISEVGAATPDVLALAEFLEEAAGVPSYGADPGSSFSPLGDTDGLLILVSPGRAWFPTTDRLATTSPITIEATGHRPGIFPLGAGSTLQIRQLS